MSDAYSYSYSYSGSYSYSYSDTETEEKAAAVKAPPPPSRPQRKPPAPATDDYSYSYSYSDPSSPPQTHPPGKPNAAPPAAEARATPQRNAAAAAAQDDNGSYSFSYSYSDDYGDYTGSESDGGARNASPGPRRGGPTPTPAEAARAGKRKGAAALAAGHGPSSSPPARQPTSAPAGADDTGSYSYSYSYPEKERQRGGKTPGGGAGGGPSDSYYAYSDDYGTYTYSDDDYYPDSYSYTGDSSYYYYSDSASGGAGGGKAKKQRKDTGSSYYYSDAYSNSYYYGDDNSYSDYYYTGDNYSYSEYAYDDSDYYYSSNAEYSNDSPHYQGDEEGSDYSDYYYSYTDSAPSKSASSTTSSYGYTGSNASLMSVPETEKARETVVLRAPAQDTPQTPPAPRRCFVAPRSGEDVVWAFLQRLLLLQQTYEARRTAAAAATAAAPPTSFLQPPTTTAAAAATARAAVPDGSGGGVEEQKGEKGTKKRRWSRSGPKSKEKKSAKDDAAAAAARASADEETLHDGPAAAPFVPTKADCLSERSLRIAFRVLQLNHLERTEALKNAPVPLPLATMVDVYTTCVTARAKERVAQAFLAHDTYRSGELPLTVMGGLLRRLGLGTSPTMEGIRISLAASTDAIPEMVMNVEQLVQVPVAESVADVAEGGGETTATTVPPPPEGNKKTLQWEVTPVYVSRIIRNNAAAKKPTPVVWEHNTIYMGRHVIVRNITNGVLFERLKTYIEAATYLCVLSSVFSVHDAEKGTVTVQYPQFVRSVLLATPPTRRRHAAQPSALKLLAIENLFRTVFHPMEVLRAFEAGRSFPRYLHDWAIESTLAATKDTEEKRRRNVVPSISADSVRFLPAPPTRPPTEASLSFVLQKVRVPGQPPANARCFCLVSAVTPADVFLPAIEVPVHKMVKSKKDPGSLTWVFYEKKYKKEAVLHFTGSTVDRLYVECCYETREPALAAEDVAAREAADATLPDSATATVWCAGYAVFGVEGAKTAALPVSIGSLLNDLPAAATPLPPAASTPAATPEENVGKKGKSAKGVFGFPSRFSRHKHRIAAEAASSIKVEVVKVKKPIAGVEKLPARFLAFQRHLSMIAQLRSAVELVGKDTDHALQALRHQAVRYIFAVAADAALLDQVCTLWTHRTKHWSKTERRDAKEQHAQLLSCVAALYALNNCCTSSKDMFARSLVHKKKKPLRMSLDEEAPLLPVRV